MIAAVPRTLPFASLEAQAAAIADDIAYNAHDIDDGLRAGLFDSGRHPRRLPFVAGLLDEIDGRYPASSGRAPSTSSARRIITRFIEDVDRGEPAADRGRAGRRSPRRRGGGKCARRLFAGDGGAPTGDSKRFLFARMYRHPTVRARARKADAIVRRLFEAYLADPAAMPSGMGGEGGAGRAGARAVADYIAGMTDRFAIAEHRRLFDEAPDLR